MFLGAANSWFGKMFAASIGKPIGGVLDLIGFFLCHRCEQPLCFFSHVRITATLFTYAIQKALTQNTGN
jgi:hypothetical protein